MHPGLGLAESGGLATAGMELLGGVTAPLAIPSLAEAGGAIAVDGALSTVETAVNRGGFGLGLLGSGLNAAQGLSGKDAHDWYWGANDLVGLGLHGTAAVAEGTMDWVDDGAPVPEMPFGHFAE